MLVVIDWPDHGGARVRDVASLEGRDFDEVRWDVRRLTLAQMRRAGVLVPAKGRKGWMKVVPPSPIADSPSPV